MPENIVITAELKDLVSGHLKDISSQVDRLEGSLSNINRSQSASGGGGLMGSFLGANLLTGAIQKAGSAIVDFGKESVEAYQRQENYEARLTTLLGSRKAAELDIMNLRKDAAKTPFDLGSLIQGNAMLIGAGESAGSARKSIMDLGNAIAATGGGSDELSRMSVNLAQIKSIGKASAMDVKQFMFANIPIYDLLAKTMKKPISEIKKMDIPYKDLTKALAEARQEGGKFYQGLENASNTLSGLRSNLDDTIESLQANIGETWADTFKDSIRGLLPMLDALNEGLTNSNRISKTLNEQGLGYSFAEKMVKPTEAGSLASLKSNIDKQIGLAGEDPMQAKVAEKGFKNLIKQIGEDYVNQRDLYEMTNEGDAPDPMKAKREIALLNDGLLTLKELGKKGDANKDKELGSGAGPKASDLETVAKGNRPTQVNINIENLVREYKPQVADNGKEVYKVTQEDVAKALLAAVNDASVMKFGS